VTAWPPDSPECVFLGRVLEIVPAAELWPKIISGEIAARVYCVGRADFAPIPVSPLEFLNADQADILHRFQIDVREDDRRRPSRVRRRIPVPHWIYLVRSTVPKPTKPGGNRGRRPIYNWDAIGKRAGDLMDENGDFSGDDPAWNAQARLEERLTDQFGVEKSALRAWMPDFLEKWRSRKMAGK
jgi:hypothetical protein